MSKPELGSFEAELEQTGEETVRQKLDYGDYSAGKIPSVNSWLRKIEEERQAVARKGDEDHKKAELAVSRSAKNAAWVAAVAAIVSIVISVIALVRTFS